MRHYRLVIFPILLIMVFTVPVFAVGDDAPVWLTQVAKTSTPVYEKDVPAVVLHDEGIVTVGTDGKVTTTTTFAVKILLREGRYMAIARTSYLMNFDKVKEIKAWLIKSNGSVKKYGKDYVVDSVSSPNDIYDEYHVSAISAKDDAEAGDVFGYQIIKEEKPQFNQDAWYFQSDIPVLMSRYTLNLPADWKATGVTFNYAKVNPTINGSTYTWEVRNLSPIPDEPLSPSHRNIAPRLSVQYAPPENVAQPTATYKVFKDWVDVSRWDSELSDPQVVLDDSLAAKARDLTANAKTEFEKIYAIGHYVQNLQYISIDIGVGRGGGYRPRLSTLVFAKGYGDCKDKANLMRAMLRALKIDAYPVSIYSGDPNFVREEWPSPQQFNHCIIAVKVSDETKSNTIITHPALGRLLIFDATDTHTPVGDLPYYLQGSLGVIGAGDKGGLVRMPVTPPETNKQERQAEVVLDPTGAVTVTVNQKSVGQSAMIERAFYREVSKQEYNGGIERWISRSVPGAQINKIEPKDMSGEGKFVLDIGFTAMQYGQLQGGRLLVFKPALLSRTESLSLTTSKRIYPIVLTSRVFTETVRVKLPSSFDVEEMPDAVKLETEFGSYDTSYQIKEGYLVYTRTLLQRAATLPVEKYADVQKFFSKIREAEQTPVVLLKK